MEPKAIDPKGSVVYDATEATTLAEKAEVALLNAQDLVIDSPTMFELAGQELMAIKAQQKEVERQRVAITGPMNTAIKAVNDLFRAPAQFLEKAEAAIKAPMVTWSAEQDRLEAVAKREAERLAAAERERLAAIQREKEAEQRRAEQVSIDAANAARELADAGDFAGAEDAAAQAVSMAHVAEAAQADAQDIARSAEIVTIRPTMVAAKVSGISGRVNYKAQTPDLMELAKAVVAGLAPVQCLLVNEQFLGAQARALKQQCKLYGVVNIVAERGISARAA